MGGLHQGKFPLHRRCALQRRTLPYSPSHLAGHGFDLFILANRRVHAVGFEMGIKGFGMLFDHIRALLVGVVGAGCKQQARAERDPITPARRTARSHVSWPFLWDESWAPSYRIGFENSTAEPKH